MADIEIEYWVPCGLLQAALETDAALLSEFDPKPDEVALTTGTGWTLSVRIDADTLYNNLHSNPRMALNQIIEAINGRPTVAV